VPDRARLAITDTMRVMAALHRAQQSEGQQDRKWPTHRSPYLSLNVPVRAFHARPSPASHSEAHPIDAALFSC
jgi:hypothetical protein